MKQFTIGLLLLGVSALAFAQDTYYSIVDGGNWDDPATWSTVGFGGAAETVNVPGANATDIVMIGDNISVVFTLESVGNATTVASLSLGNGSDRGTLIFPYSNDGSINDNDALTVTGDLTINNSSSGIESANGGETINGVLIPGSAQDTQFTLNVGGDLSLGEGVFDLQDDTGDAGRIVDLVFNGTSNQEVTDGGTMAEIDLHEVEYNNAGNNITISSDDFSNAIDFGGIFTAGTFVHNNSGSYVNGGYDADVTITTAVNFDIQSGEFTFSSIASDRAHTIQGNVTIASGIFNASTDTDGGNTGDASNLTIDGDLTMSGTAVMNASSETGLPTIPGTGFADGSLTLNGTNDFSGCTSCVVGTRDIIVNSAFALQDATFYIGNGSGGGDIQLATGITLSLDDVTFTFSGNDIDLAASATFQIENTDGVEGTYTIAENAIADNIINLDANASFVINDGTVNVAAGTGLDVSDAFELFGNGASLTVNSGAVLNILDGSMVSITDRGIRVAADGNSVIVDGGTLNIGSTGTNAGRFEIDAAAANFSLTVSNGGIMTVGEDFDNEDPANIVTTVSVTGSSSLTIGDQAEFDDLAVTNSSLTVQSNTGTATNTTLYGNTDFDNATVEFADGLNVQATATLDITTGGTLNIETTTTGSLDENRFILFGDFTQDAGTVNVAANATAKAGGSTVSIEDGANFIQNAGTFNVFESLTDADNFTAGQMFFLDDGDGDGNLTPGEVTFTVSGTLSIGANMDARATVENEVALEIESENATITINDGAVLNVGSSSTNSNSNHGQLLFDNQFGADLNTTMAIDGTVHVGGDFNIEPGFDVTIGATGELNVGINDSNGSNSIVFGNQNAGFDAITNFIVNGGTVNMGDGGANFNTGNSNNDPSFSATSRKNLTLNTGQLNINGRLEISDENIVFTMAGGTLNLNPQGATDLSSTLDVLFFDRGYIDITGGTVNILNPHATSGVGEVVHWNPVGDPSTADQISVTNNSGWILNLGDGIESSAGGDGFDLEIDAGYVLPPLTINNPTGTGRDVNFNGNSRNYVMDGALTVTAGTLDLEGSTIDLNSTATGNFTLGSGADLIIGGTDDHFPGSSFETPTAGTAINFGAYTIDAGSSVNYDGTTQTVDIPNGANTFGDLVISGSGTKTLANAETVLDSLLLQSGTFVASSNLSMGTGSTVVRSGGAFNTGDLLQGGNDYSVGYSGSSQTSASEEFSGSGNITAVTMDLTAGQTLTLHGAETIQDLNLVEGTLADAGATLTVTGNVTNTASHTGTGAILLSSASAQTIAGDTGGGSFTNLDVNNTGAGVTVTTDLTINGVFTTTSGVFDIGENQLSLSSSASFAGTPGASAMIQLAGTTSEDGIVRTFPSTNSGSPFTFPIGVGGKYTPVSAELISATGLGDLTIKPVDDLSATTDPSDLELSYYWRLSSSISNPTVTLNFTYDENDVPAGANEAAFIPARLSGANWDDIQDVSQVNDATNVITFDNVDYITGDFTAAEPTEFGVVASFYSLTDGDWEDPNSWSTEGFGGSAATTFPSSGQVVFIGNNVTITTGSDDNLAAFSLEIQSTGTLQIGDGSTGHDFGTVTGTGTLDIISNSATTPEFPGGTFSDFLGTSGGTVNYSGTGSYTLPTQSNYNNLSFSGSGDLTFPDATVTLDGDLTIANDGTVSFSDATSGDVSVGGSVSVQDGGTTILQFPGTTARTVSVTGNITVDADATFDVTNSGSVTHSLFAGGSLTNAGTFDMNTGGSVVDVTFTGAASNSVSGAGATFDFNRLIVNKGTAQANVLTLSSDNISIGSSAALDSKPIELQNGTLQIDNNLGTFDLTTDGSNTSAQAFSIPSTAGLILNNTDTDLRIISPVGANEEGGNLLLAGALEIRLGDFIIGNDATGVTDNDLLYSGSAASFNISGGTLTISGGFRIDRLNQTDTEINSTVVDYDQTGGTVTTTLYRYVRDVRNANNNNGDVDVGTTASGTDSGGFEILNTSTFDMNAGSIIAVHGGATDDNDDGIPFLIGPNVTGAVSGGTVQVLNSNTTSQNIELGIASSLALWDLNIGDGTTFQGQVGGVDGQQQDLVVQNDFTLNLPTGDFQLFDVSGGEDAENYSLTIGRNFTITAGTFEGGRDDTDADENDVIFNGTNHTINWAAAGDVLLHDLTFDHSGTATFNTDINLNGEWTYNSGTVDLSSSTVVFHENFGAANPINENPAISGSAFTFPNLTFEGDAATTGNFVPTINSDVTVSGTLTITNDTINITTSTLNVSTVSVDANSFIETSGNETDGGVIRTFTTPTNEVFTYPLGMNGIRRDVEVDVSDGGTGTINVVPVASQNTFVESTDALGVYWEITALSFTSPTILYTFNYIDPTDINGTETNYVGATFDGANFTIEDDVVNGDSDGDVFDDVGNTFTIASTNNGSSLQFLAGDETLGFPPVETYYSISSVCGDADGCDWTLASSWSTTSHGGSAASTAPAANNPVVIAANDSVYIIAAGALSATTQIDANGVVHTTQIDNSGLGTLSGDGRFYVERTDDTDISQGGGSPLVLPDLTAGQGTVFYLYTNGTGGFDVDLPALPTAYHNLILGVSGDGANDPDFDFDNVDYTITGDLTLNDGEIFVRGDATIISDGSGTFTLRDDADVNVRGANNFPSNFGTYDLDSEGCLVQYIGDFEQTILTVDNGGGNIAYHDLDLEDNNHVFTGTLDVNGQLQFDDGGGGLSLGSGTLRISGILDFDGQNSVSGSADPVLNAQAGTVVFDGGGAVSITAVNNYTATDTVNFNNLTIEGTGTTVTFPSQAGTYTVGGTLTFSDNATLDLTSQDLIVDGDITNNSSNANPFVTIDELILNGLSSDQSINGSSSVSLANLTLQKASGVDVNVGTPVTITGTLLMQNDGNIVLDGASDFDLTIASGASITDNNSNASFSADRQVEFDGTRSGTSELILTGTGSTADSYDFYFPIGTSGQHSAVQFDVSAINNGGANSTINVKPVTGNSSSVTIGGGTITNFDNSLAIDRYFIVNTSSVTDITGTFTFSYVDGEVNGDESDYITKVWPGSGTSFEDPETSGMVNTSSNNTALNQYGGAATTFIDDATTEWITGTNAAFTPPLFSNGSGDWDVATTWNTASDGSGSNGVPSATTDVTIEDSDVITMPADGAVAILANTVELGASASINFTADYDQANSALVDVNGSGTIVLDASPGLPATIDLADFLENGTVNYDFSGDATERTIPNTITEYNNLIITDDDNTDNTFIDINTTITGDLTVDGAILNTGAGNTLETRGGITTPNFGSLDASNGTLNVAGAAAQDLGTLSVVGINNLIFSNVGSKTLSSITVNDFTIFIGTGTVDAGTGTITVTGDWSGTSAFSQSGAGNVTFSGASGDQDISGTSNFNDIIVNKAADNVSLSGDITVSGDITLTSGTINSNAQTITFSGTAATQGFLGTESIALNNLTINKSTGTDFEYDTQISSIGGDLTLTSGDFVSTGPTSLDIDGDFTIESGATFNQSGTTITSFSVGGNYVNNGGSVTLPTNISFDGTTAQTISSSLSFTNLTIDNTAGVTTNSSQTVSGTLTLTNGVLDLDQDDGNRADDPVLTIDPGTAVVGTFSDANHIEGKVATSTTFTGAYTFPVGDGGQYRPIVLDPVSANSFTTVQHIGESTPGDIVGDLVDGMTYEGALVSRYWDVVRTAAQTGNVEVTVQLDGTEDVATDFNSLALAKYDDPTWVLFDVSVNSGGSNGSVVTVSGITSGFTGIGVLTTSLDDNGLPVELVRFEGEAVDNQILLEWSTATELDNDYFEIQHSLDGVNFSTVGKVEGSGRTNELKAYSFLHKTPALGINYYRLRQVDFDGKVEDHLIIQVQNDFYRSGMDLVIYPNPTSIDNIGLRVLTGDDHTPILVRIVDINGKEQYSKTFQGTLSFDRDLVPTRALPPGLYLLIVSQGNHELEEKLIIEN